MPKPTISRLLDEIHQSPEIRQNLIKKLENTGIFKGYRILLFFTSFRFPASIADDDANIIEGVLQKTDKDKKLLILINSPGGSALAAERIINVCRRYSKLGFETLVPKMAKSAATLIALGSNKIYMSSTSELGPIDAQIRVGDKLLSAYSIVQSYRELLNSAVTTKGRIEPYLQQLLKYDEREIKELELVQGLSDDIAVKALKTGMLKGKTEQEIKRCINIFLTPESTKVHGRSIYSDVAKQAGLQIKEISVDSDIWQIVWELFIRADHIVSNSAAKLVETSQQHFQAGIPNL